MFFGQRFMLFSFSSNLLPMNGEVQYNWYMPNFRLWSLMQFLSGCCCCCCWPLIFIIVKSRCRLTWCQRSHRSFPVHKAAKLQIHFWFMTFHVVLWIQCLFNRSSHPSQSLKSFTLQSEKKTTRKKTVHFGVHPINGLDCLLAIIHQLCNWSNAQDRMHNWFENEHRAIAIVTSIYRYGQVIDEISCHSKCHGSKSCLCRCRQSVHFYCNDNRFSSLCTRKLINENVSFCCVCVWKPLQVNTERRYTSDFNYVSFP